MDIAPAPPVPGQGAVDHVPAEGPLHAPALLVRPHQGQAGQGAGAGLLFHGARLHVDEKYVDGNVENFQGWWEGPGIFRKLFHFGLK